MAKRMTNKEREEKRLFEDRRLRVIAALEMGITTRKDLAKAAEISLPTLHNLFTKDRELYARFCVTRRTLVDMASDNIAEIVADPLHPKNYDASKYVLNNYKSDIDDALESKDDESLGVEISGSGESKGSPIVLKFVKSNKPKNED